MNRNKKIPFFQIPTPILECGGLSFGAIVTFSVLIRCESYRICKHQTRDGFFWESRAHIASVLHKSSRSVSDYIRELVNARIIERKSIPSFDSYGPSKHDWFRINWERVQGLRSGETQTSDIINRVVPYPQTTDNSDVDYSLLPEEEQPF